MKINFRDKQYQTLGACYQDNKDLAKVSLPTFVTRVREGFSIEEAFSTKKDMRLITHLGSHLVEGVEYKNLPSIARAYGMKPMAVYKRYNRGKRGDDLVPPKKRRNYVPPPPPEPKKPPYEVEIGGVTYKSISEACRLLGVKWHTYINRRRRDATLEECLNIEPYIHRRKKNIQTVEYKGELLTFKDIQNRFGLYQTTFIRRLEKGFSIEEALEKKSRSKNKLTWTEEDLIK
jgi:hypothetical protein